MKRTEHMSEEQQENVAEELTEWSEIDLSPEDKKEKVEFEVEGSEPEELVAEPEPQPDPEPVAAEAPEEMPELDGIETKGAEKRIRQLVKQKKERDERIAQLEAERQQFLQTILDYQVFVERPRLPQILDQKVH